MNNTSRPSPRQRPKKTPAATDSSGADLDLTKLLQAQPQIDAGTAAPDKSAGSSKSTGSSDPGQQWRVWVSELAEAAGLTDEQEAELERLARSQGDRIQEEIPRLLIELEPHFDTPQEAEAKQRYEAGLRALKAEFDEQTTNLLHSFGIRREEETDEAG